MRDPSPGLALTTTFTYSQFGDVTWITDPRSSTTTITVDAEGYVEEIEAPSPLNYHRRFTYGADRQVTLVEVENRDKDGNLDPNTPWIDTALQYDEIGRLTAKTVRLTANTTATTSYAYDGSGSLVELTSPEGSVTRFAWDERRLLFRATRGYGTQDASTIQLDYGAERRARDLHERARVCDQPPVRPL